MLEFFVLLLLIAVAGGLGSVLRLFIGQWQGKLPWGILLANLIGSFAAGFIGGIENWFIAVILISGLAGGLSTFSTFAAQSVEYMRRGRIAQGLLNVLANLALSSTAVLLGLALASQLLK